MVVVVAAAVVVVVVVVAARGGVGLFPDVFYVCACEAQLLLR